MKYIIDTDPGIDDMLAILFALKSQIKIIGITTVFGNSSVEDSTKNTLATLQLLDSQIPVYEGAAKPLLGKRFKATSHGKNGYGGAKRNLKSGKSRIKAFDYLKEPASCPDKITLIAIGPLTNIANVIKYSSNPDIFKEIIIMGGVFGQAGNITPYAEFNAYSDSLAWDIVLKSSIPKTIIPADVCREVVFEQSILKLIKDSKLSDKLEEISKNYFNYYLKDKKFGGFRGAIMYDLLTIAYVLNPNIFKVKRKKVEIELLNVKTFGMTRFSARGSMCNVVANVDSEKVKKLFLDKMNT